MLLPLRLRAELDMYFEEFLKTNENSDKLAGAWVINQLSINGYNVHTSITFSEDQRRCIYATTLEVLKSNYPIYQHEEEDDEDIEAVEGSVSSTRSIGEALSKI